MRLLRRNIVTFAMNCSKYLVLGINCIFSLLGIVLIGVGGYVLVEVKEYAVTQSGKRRFRDILLIKLDSGVDK